MNTADNAYPRSAPSTSRPLWFATLLTTTLLGLTVGCAPSSPSSDPPPSGAPSSGQLKEVAPEPEPATPEPATPEPTPKEADALEPRPKTSHPTPPDADVALEVLFLDAPDDAARACLGLDAPVACMLAHRYRGDRVVARQVRQLYDTHGIVVGIEEPHMMNGGYRGTIEIVPHLPVGKARKHVGWVADAFSDFERFFDAMGDKADAERQIDFAFAPVIVRFFRSVGRRTPSAYAARWRIGYNVSGSLHRNGNSVRETLFHEVFHLNDEAHGAWSLRALGKLHAAIIDRCVDAAKPKASIPCLRPYAPGTTRVKGGTYYAFQPGNDAQEYGAELAVRYYMEHRLVLAGKALPKKAFKCGPDENREAWELFKDEFFGGIDLVGACR